MPLLAAVVCLLTALPCFAQRPIIESIVWEGLRRIPRDTMNARILSKPGDPYDPAALQRDFQAVWNTNFFEDVRMEVEDGEEGKIIYFIVEERPLIRRIAYDGIKSVQESEILEAFRERRVGLTVEMQYDPTRVRQGEVVLKQLLSSRGRHFAKVYHEATRIPPNAVVLTFVAEEGPKVKVGNVRFEGNRRFSDRRLVRAMKGTRPYGVPPGYIGLFPKTYNEFKLQEDLESVRELYQEHGYFRVIVQPPDPRYRDTKPFFALREALENYRKMYSEVGFINMTTVPETDIDDNTRTINMTMEFEPNKQFFVRRIDFTGNTHTRDKVIRREGVQHPAAEPVGLLRRVDAGERRGAPERPERHH
jgi:outer membrane protein insertion porin family